MKSGYSCYKGWEDETEEKQGEDKENTVSNIGIEPVASLTHWERSQIQSQENRKNQKLTEEQTTLLWFPLSSPDKIPTKKHSAFIDSAACAICGWYF